ncbi:MAG: tRNA pseudouridine(38-40) synthase TruA [Ruminococcaceae bacterium]|nr:tRNA pseudouridine(38-40) synthase TruA [Oscillospiraceae bacterium]
MNYKLQLMYDGTAYAGWQKQNNAITIQDQVEKALAVILRQPVSLVGVSRTDAGVHAADYTANFHAEGLFDAKKICRGVNALLPPDIRIMDAIPCSDNFNARFDAIKKTYVYRIDCSSYGNAFYRNFVWHHPIPLDVESMKHAAGYFLGLHDFSAFMAQGGSSKTFTREIMESHLTEQNNILEYHITGNGFLYNMVRIIAGTLVWVGRGKINPDDIPNILESKDRTHAGMTAPAKGLTLAKAYYNL